ncbi:WLM-domain-containing protein [Stereum hirsutum FP-91666 SS1]|uniref:WLM-domain-containing protein n=1 Tax=Stereum hirsutum (strain FP-91666) TaxID=721885 RepID=UPI000440E469|nr:WLM-domain-containing protein [Stereum hirsutum FP-91666 SS1]EIM91267.1 WLM-domain-containing protein [Stereum hirsutum FP-91666 SS1]
MVHNRLNENETNPNPNINFITALPTPHDPQQQEHARQLLRALAAQVKPVMKAHGFVVNSFEEYEFNAVFSGRNWNAGETVELVLRGPHGGRVPTSYLMSTLCHELAHINHMNHGPDFQKLWAQLRQEVRALQERGYYGDGYWSSGTRLADSATVSGSGIEAGDLPEYMCGGAQTRSRPSNRRRRRIAGTETSRAGPSTHTGAQTAKKRKAGGRLTAKGAFRGDGVALNDGGESKSEVASQVGTGFGKRAGSKKAREERALAFERRIAALQGKGTSSENGQDSDSDSSDFEIVPETDSDRRRAMLDSDPTGNAKLKGTNGKLEDFWDEFIIPRASSSSSGSQPKGKEKETNVPSGATAKKDGDGLKQRTLDGGAVGTGSDVKGNGKGAAKGRGMVLGNIVQDEVEYRKKEALGMTKEQSEGRTLGGNTKRPGPGLESGWACLICTLENESGHLACSACGTERGQASWEGNYS